MRKVNRVALGITLILPIAYGVYVARMNYQGYCIAQGRQLTDEEKLRVAIAYELKQYPPAVDYHKPPPEKQNVAAGYFLKPINPIYYRDVDEFLAVNPGCCQLKLKRSVDQPVLLFRERASGAVTSFARITYKVRFLDKDNNAQAIEHTTYPALSNCGVPFNEPDMLFMSDLLFYYLALMNRTKP